MDTKARFLTALLVVYAYRFSIEELFREFKQQIGGFAYHFWTKAVPN